VEWGLLAPELAVNPRETVATAAMAAIRFPNTMRVVSPQGSAFRESALRMSDAFVDSQLQFIAGIGRGLWPICVIVLSQ
jgi:hypothetical protein